MGSVLHIAAADDTGIHIFVPAAAGLVAVVAYCITAFSRTIDNRVIGLLSPLSYFNPSAIHENGFYEWNCLFLYLLLAAASFIFAYMALLKRDVKFAA